MEWNRSRGELNVFRFDWRGKTKWPLELPPDRLKRFFDNLEPAFSCR
jgi:hypothetical protein